MGLASGYSPCILFRLGMTHLLMGDVTAARQTWERLLAEFSEHPLGRDAPVLLDLTQQPQSVRRVCEWLSQGEKCWGPFIIIGADVAGLSAGCYGQMNGYDTKIFELHTLPGGLCTSWKRKGYVFDGCIH